MAIFRKAGLATTVLAIFGLGVSNFVSAKSTNNASKLKKINHIVVIYQENHSFDNLYGGWEGVNGLKNALAFATNRPQIDRQGVPFTCLLQNDVNLTSPTPIPPSCHGTTATTFSSAFQNAPFSIDRYIAAGDRTCPPVDITKPEGIPKNSAGALPGGCTRDIVHRFYQEQYQIDNGKMDRFVVGSDAVGLSMGYYNTRQLPIYKYLHQPGHPKYAIADNFFQAAFGGSFLNHQWLIAAATPIFAKAVQDGSNDDLHSIVDDRGFPNQYPLYVPSGAAKDSRLTVKCSSNLPKAANGGTLACGDYAINTIQPTYQPFLPGTKAAQQLPPLTAPTIGDRLSAAGVSWAWYSGGWSNANGDVGAPGWTNGNGSKCSDPQAFSKAIYPNCPDYLFQFHHQPFNYYQNYAPGSQARKEHLKDEQEFLALAKSSTRTCRLKSVSFVKPIGEENEHPGYASTSTGNNHLVELIAAVENGPCGQDTAIVVTYDEFGGQWDHVTPPGQGNQRGPSDRWGPGTRVPALVISQLLDDNFVVDSQPHDTTSILATIEHRYGLKPLADRDAKVLDLSTVFQRHGSKGKADKDD